MRVYTVFRGVLVFHRGCGVAGAGSSGNAVSRRPVLVLPVGRFVNATRHIEHRVVVCPHLLDRAATSVQGRRGLPMIDDVVDQHVMVQHDHCFLSDVGGVAELGELGAMLRVVRGPGQVASMRIRLSGVSRAARPSEQCPWM